MKTKKPLLLFNRFTVNFISKLQRMINAGKNSGDSRGYTALSDVFNTLSILFYRNYHSPIYSYSQEYTVERLKKMRDKYIQRSIKNLIFCL